MCWQAESSKSGPLREAVGVGDANSVEWIAHTLSGGSANMGALEMAMTCSELLRCQGAELARNRD